MSAARAPCSPALAVVLGLLDRQFGKSTIAAVGHRIVHGGVEFTESVVLDDRKTASLYRLAPLAPLHQPHNLLGVRAAHRASPEAAQVACFDNHRAHPWVNDTYALPRELYEQGIRHYGAVRGGVRITDHSVNFDSDQCAAM